MRRVPASRRIEHVAEVNTMLIAESEWRKTGRDVAVGHDVAIAFYEEGLRRALWDRMILLSPTPDTRGQEVSQRDPRNPSETCECLQS